MPDFQSVKAQITDGDILLFRGKFSLLDPSTWFSGLIRLWTNWQFTHIGVACWGDFGGVRDLYCWEAMEGSGVRVVTVERYLKRGCRIDWYQLVHAETCRPCVIEWFRQREGNRYASVWQLWRSFTLLPLAERLKLPTVIGRDRYFCSMAVGMALEACGFDGHIQLGKRPEQLSPGDFSRLPGLMPRGPLSLTAKGSKR